jgi:hypothetical protein
MSRRGDYQRSAVYRWEAEHVHPKDTGTVPFDQAQAIVDYVWARAGLTYPPKIRELARTAWRTTANADRLTISIPATGVSTTVLLHEIAHSMTSDAARWCIAAAAARIDDECASPFSDNSGLRSGDLDPEEGAIRWSISLVWTYR